MSMRVALIGNMNNIFFALSRFLRERGVDAELLLFEHEFDHFHPSADTYDLEYMNYTRQLSWGNSNSFLSTPTAKIREDLADYDVLIGCGLAPAYCQKAGRNLDVFVPSGGDIWTETFYKLCSPHRLPNSWMAVHFQRKGIGQSKVFHMTLTNDLYEGQFNKLRGRAVRWTENLPMVHNPTYAPKSIGDMVSRTHWGFEFLRLRTVFDLMVFYHARHCWGCPVGDPHAKGTDKLLRGWSLFVKRNPHIRAVLVTLEYGKDVSQSKTLINSLGISDSVVWFPKMFRKDLMIGLDIADIACGEFVNSWMTSGVLYEALVMGKPILAWRDDELYRGTYPNLYPILNAKSPESIATRLEEYVRNPEACKKIGKIGRRWYEEEVVKKGLDRYLAYIHNRGTELGKSTINID